MPYYLGLWSIIVQLAYSCLNVKQSLTDSLAILQLYGPVSLGKMDVAALDLLKEKGAQNIRLLNIISSKQGVEKLKEKHPDVEGFTCAVDPVLDDNGYITPGLGDAGDRLFGTE